MLSLLHGVTDSQKSCLSLVSKQLGAGRKVYEVSAIPLSTTGIHLAETKVSLNFFYVVACATSVTYLMRLIFSSQ
jgi:hypothetical protein